MCIFHAYVIFQFNTLWYCGLNYTPPLSDVPTSRPTQAVGVRKNRRSTAAGAPPAKTTSTSSSPSNATTSRTRTSVPVKGRGTAAARVKLGPITQSKVITMCVYTYMSVGTREARGPCAATFRAPHTVHIYSIRINVLTTELTPMECQMGQKSDKKVYHHPTAHRSNACNH